MTFPALLSFWKRSVLQIFIGLETPSTSDGFEPEKPCNQTVITLAHNINCYYAYIHKAGDFTSGIWCTYLKCQILTSPNPNTRYWTIIIWPKQAHGCKGILSHLIEPLVHACKWHKSTAALNSPYFHILQTKLKVYTYSEITNFILWMPWTKHINFMCMS